MRFLFVCLALGPLYSQITSPGFEPNRGDYPAEVRFARRLGGSTYFLTRDGVQFPSGLGVQILNVPAASEPRGESPSPIPVNLYRGNNPADWRINQRFFEAVRIADIGQGASAVFTVVVNSSPAPSGIPAPAMSKQRITLSFPPGADPERLRLRVSHPGGPVFEGPDGIWFVGGSVPGVFVVSGRAFQNGVPLGIRLGVASSTIGFTLAGRDATRSTQVEIEFPNFDFTDPRPLPGPAADGNRYVTSITTRVVDSQRTESDVVLSRVDSQGRALWITLLGGRESDFTNFGGTVASGGTVTLAGSAESNDLPLTTNGRAKGASRAEPFLASFDTATGTLKHSTFLGVDAPFAPTAMAVNRAGDVVAGGQATNELGYLVRWRPDQNRLLFSAATALPVRALTWEDDENFYALSFRPAAKGVGLEGYNAAGPFGSPVEIGTPEPVKTAELIPAGPRSYYLLLGVGEEISTHVSRVAPRDGGLIFTRRLAQGLPGEYAVRPDGSIQILFSNMSTAEPTSSNAQLAAACLQSSYYVSIAPDGSLRYATYLPSGRFDFPAQSDTPPAPAPRLVCAAATAGRAPLYNVAAGQLITLTGAGFGPVAPVYSQPDAFGKYPVTLAGYEVRVAGQPAPVIAVARGLVAIQMPFGVTNTVTTATAELSGPDVRNVTLELTVSTFQQPALFDTGERTGQLAMLAALNQDGTVNGPANPAKAGSVISVFGSGLGELFTPVKETGALNPLAAQPVPGLVSGCGAGCGVLYFGTAPGLSTGIFQANLLITPKTGTQVFGFDFQAATAFRNLIIMGSRYGVYVKD